MDNTNKDIIVIKNPSPRALAFFQMLKERQEAQLEKMKTMKCDFTIHVESHARFVVSNS